MTNEVSQGLGIRQPAGPAGGGNSLFGITKFLVQGQNFNTFKNDGAGNSGVILFSQPIGTLTDEVIPLLWNLVGKGHFTTVVNPTRFETKLLVRDSTLMPSPTLAQAIAALSGGNFRSGVQNVTAIGDFIGLQYFVVWDYECYPGSGHTKDDYGNTFAPGDSLAMDLLTWCNQTNVSQTGTFDAGCWFSNLFLP